MSEPSSVVPIAREVPSRPGPPWRIIALASIPAPILAGVVFFAITVPDLQFEGKCRKLLGKSRAEAVKALGPAQFVITPTSVAGKRLDYPWTGMNYRPIPTRTVTGEVLLYQRPPTAAYLFVDKQGVVEHVAIAGT